MNSTLYIEKLETSPKSVTLLTMSVSDVSHKKIRN